MYPSLTVLLHNNDPPTVQQVGEIRSLLDSAAAESSQLDNVISKLSIVLSLLKVKRQRADALKAFQNILSPVRGIPSENLGEIFLHCRDNDAGYQLTTKKAPLLLGHVSSRWRMVLHSIPGLGDCEI
ncbi:hypothetical protein DFH09DRAFT_948886, partial [Mycena vulgaris]